jgi:hypothetical protein
MCGSTGCLPGLLMMTASSSGNRWFRSWIFGSAPAYIEIVTNTIELVFTGKTILRLAERIDLSSGL